MVSLVLGLRALGKVLGGDGRVQGLMGVFVGGVGWLGRLVVGLVGGVGQGGAGVEAGARGCRGQVAQGPGAAVVAVEDGAGRAGVRVVLKTWSCSFYQFTGRIGA